MKALDIQDRTSKLGFGTGNLYGGPTRNESLRIVQSAIDFGIDWIDTAPLYGHGEAESIVGEALHGNRERVTLVSKVGIEPTKITNSYRLRSHAARMVNRMLPKPLIAEPKPLSPRFHVFGANAVRYSVERSLRALRTDRIDALLLHECTAEEAMADSLLRVLEDLVTTGKVVTLGIATQPAAATEVSAAWETLPYNLIQLGYDPTGDYRLPEQATLSVHSALSAWLPKLTAALVQTSPAGQMAERLGLDLRDLNIPALLLGVAMAQPGVDTVLFSTRSESRLRDLLLARELEPGMVAAIAKLLGWMAGNA